MKTIVIAAAIMLSLSHPASAQSLKLPTAVFAGAAAADWASTYVGIEQHGMHDSNPMLRFTNTNGLGAAAAGTALDVAGVWAWNRYVGRKHPKIAAVGLYAATSFRLYLVQRNVRLMQPRERLVYMTHFEQGGIPRP